jgi:hypothetical protein
MVQCTLFDFGQARPISGQCGLQLGGYFLENGCFIMVPNVR